MRIIGIEERAVAISRYRDPAVPSGGLNTSIVAVITDVVRRGARLIGLGFGSIGRFAQSGLIRERFKPRILAAAERDLLTDDERNIDPFKAWRAMMKDEKPGGHGERCVAVGALDMAIWDAAAKIEDVPLAAHLSRSLGSREQPPRAIPVYAGGGYLYPADDLALLKAETGRMTDMGFNRMKIKVGGGPTSRDCRRIEAVLEALPKNSWLAVDAMNSYESTTAAGAAGEFGRYGLRWFEDICDPHDFETQRRAAHVFGGPIAVGEALFSHQEAMLLDKYGGLRRERDVLVFDPAHCYGIPGFLKIVRAMEDAGWPRASFWPHGGHLYAHHVVAALGLGGAEVNPLSFSPFGGLADGACVQDGLAHIPEMPGIGFESRKELATLFESMTI